MSVTSLYPVLMSGDVAAAADFYRKKLSFETTFDAGWYISLRLGTFELALLAHDDPTVPEKHRALPQGVILNLEVDNVDEVYQQVDADEGVVTLLPLRDEDFGQRHFIVQAPDDVLLDVIQPIHPSAEYAGAYSA